MEGVEKNWHHHLPSALYVHPTKTLTRVGVKHEKNDLGSCLSIYQDAGTERELPFGRSVGHQEDVYSCLRTQADMKISHVGLLHLSLFSLHHAVCTYTRQGKERRLTAMRGAIGRVIRKEDVRKFVSMILRMSNGRLQRRTNLLLCLDFHISACRHFYQREKRNSFLQPLQPRAHTTAISPVLSLSLSFLSVFPFYSAS